jgi:hypothetical protein
MREVEILEKTGHTRIDAEIISAASFRAIHDTVLALADILDEISQDRGLQLTALLHIPAMVASDMRNLLEKMMIVSTMIAMGGSAQDMTDSASADCACSRCVATRALVKQLRPQIEIQQRQE